MITKTCISCGAEKPLEEYHLRSDTGKRRNECDTCRLARMRQRHIEHREEDNARYREYDKSPKGRESHRLAGKRYYEANKERIQARHRINGLRYYYEHREQELERKREYAIKNRDKINARQNRYRTERKERDPAFKLRLQTRTLLHASLNSRGYKKNTKTEKLLGCSPKEFVLYLLGTYKKNYGVEWDGKEPVHIDHIIPVATAKTEAEVIKAQHYTNLQLLKARDNMLKHDKLNWIL